MSEQPKATSPAPDNKTLPPCRHCQGTGRQFNGWYQQCQACEGTGTEFDDHGGNIGVQVACQSCNGTGQAMNKEAELEWCMWCRGTGVAR